MVHTYSGYENRVKINLDKRVASMDMLDKIFRVLVPMEEEKETKDGKTRTVNKKTFPGYVIVEMVMTDDSWYVVRNTPGVTGFVGSPGAGSKPNPLMPDEVDDILRKMGEDTPKTEIDLELKESVKVNEGPFTDFTGTVEEINGEKQKVKVHVNMFGRETPVELDFHQVEKI
ncbi:transcription antitermination protein nusG [Natribacillus halophilus]|uniref:Transcription termination/antitermination protein NusG n=1 Tax=Natribacillus halophilus TaxID=549003 RepID=A0A1G8QZ20_9BACI|nr:transcription antitermination protein nusG [Natribacillus halophilus]